MLSFSAVAQGRGVGIKITKTGPKKLKRGFLLDNELFAGFLVVRRHGDMF
jgi:hypothetical protein